MAINSTEKDTLDTPTEATEAVNVLKSAMNTRSEQIRNYVFPGDDEGTVRCDVCFALFLDLFRFPTDPTLIGKGPHTYIFSCW